MQAIWKETVIAESDATILIEGNHYFPMDSLNEVYFQDSEKTSQCFWKGKAQYKHVSVNGEINKDACWYYPEPKKKAQNIKGYCAFWKDVEVK